MFAVPAALILVASGYRKTGITVLCALSLLGGMYLSQGRTDLESVSASGVWRCRIETTTTAGALMVTPSGNTVWSSDRELARSVSRGDSVVIIGSINGSFMQSSAFYAIQSTSLQDRIRRVCVRTLAENIPSRSASSLASALLAGERGNLPPSVRTVFSDTGTSHLLALSGLHVGIVSSFLLIFLRKLFGRGWVSIVAVILATFIYIFISGARASTVRAGVMLLLVLVLMHASGRTPDLLFVWSVAVIILSIASTGKALNDTGAQMSFGAVLSLIVAGRSYSGKAGWILSMAHAGVVVTIALAPLVSFTYGGLSPVAPVATVISVPFMLGTMITGLLSIIFPFSASVLTEWIVFAWLGLLKVLESGRVIFQYWMFLLWPLCIIVLWLFSRRRGFLRRFR